MYINEAGQNKGMSVAAAKTDVNYSQLFRLVASAKYEK